MSQEWTGAYIALELIDDKNWTWDFKCNFFYGAIIPSQVGTWEHKILPARVYVQI